MSSPKLAVLSVVLNAGHVLLVRRKNEPDAGLWGFPGGHVEFGEPVAQAACRELAEETSVQATPIRTLTGLEIITPDIGDPAFHFYLVAVQCAYVSGAPIPQDDVSDAAWVPHEDVLQGHLPLSDDVDNVLQLALAEDDA